MITFLISLIFQIVGRSTKDTWTKHLEPHSLWHILYILSIDNLIKDEINGKKFKIISLDNIPIKKNYDLIFYLIITFLITIHNIYYLLNHIINTHYKN